MQVKQYHAATVRPDLTTIVVIGDITPEAAKAVVEKWFGDWKATGPKPETTLPAIPVNKPSAANVADAEQVQDSVVLAEQLSINRFDPDYYPLQLGTHVLGGGFYATRLYHDLRQVAGYVYTVDVGLQRLEDPRQLYRQLRLRSGERLEGAPVDRARPEPDAHRAGVATPSCIRPRRCCCGRFRSASRARRRSPAACLRAHASGFRSMSRSARPISMWSSTRRT